VALSVNWGIAAVVYFVAGAIIASIIATPAPRCARFGAIESR
jgi:hypothetical protein